MTAIVWASVPAALVVAIAWLAARAPSAGVVGDRPLVPPMLAARLPAWRPRVQAPGAGGGELADLLRLRAAMVGGASVVAALDDLGRGRGCWADPSASAAAQVRAGLTMADALEGWARRGGPAARLTADALLVAMTTGGSVIGALDVAVEVVRANDGLTREVRMLSAPARASALVVAAAPMAFALALVVVDPRVRAFFTTSWEGLACVAIGVVLDGIGAWWMALLIGRIR